MHGPDAALIKRIRQHLGYNAATRLAEARDAGAIDPVTYRRDVKALRDSGVSVQVLADGLGRGRASVYELLATADRHTAA